MAEPQKSGLLPSSAGRTLILAVCMGVVGIALMVFYLRSRERKRVVVSVALATRPMAEGDTIRKGAVIAKEVPKDMIGGKFVSGNDIVAVEGRVVSADMDPGQPLYWNAILLAAEGGYDRYLRPENRDRAFAINMNGPRVRSGDVVDIIGTYAQGTRRDAFEVLPAVTVIDHAGRTLVLNVTPEEELLLLAAEPCNLTYAIRSKLEPNEDLKLNPVSIADILPKAKALGTARTVRLRVASSNEGAIQRD
jgi:Flp pilus assembly protein CpaB